MAIDDGGYGAPFADEDGSNVIPIERARATAAKVPPRYTVLDGAAIAGPLPELEYVVRELGMVAGAGAPHLLTGYGFSGKTVACQSMLLSLAAGRPVWGIYGCRPMSVLHVDQEQGERLTRRRYQRLARGLGVDLASLGGALALVTMPSVRLCPEDRALWVEMMTGRSLMVVDSLRASTPGQDENSSEMGAALDMLGSVSEDTGCRALVIHHHKKPSNDGDNDARFAIRGSGAIYDACDSAYCLTAKKGEPIEIQQVKARSHGEPIEPLAVTIKDVECDGDPKGALAVRAHGVELVRQHRQEQAAADAAVAMQLRVTRVLEVVRKHPGISSAELRATVGGTVSLTDAAVMKLADKLMVNEVKEGRTWVKRHYLK